MVLDKPPMDAYRVLFSGHLSSQDIVNIRRATHYSQPLGDDRFAEFIQERYGVKLGIKRRGRPAKTVVG